MKKKWTYAKAGVDISQSNKAHAEIGKLIKKTFKIRTGKFGNVIGKFGHYASLIDTGGKRALALHADGCGTKVLIAQLLNKYDTVGMDCVAMCANDLICLGAEPLALVDYLAVEKPHSQMIQEIMKGLVNGAKIAGMAVIGGETAVMPDVIKGAVKGKGFDLAALSLGVVEKEKTITGEKISPGDVVIGLESSGIHSNGLTLARKIFEDAGLSVKSKPKELDRTVGEELITPTKIYVREVLQMLQKVDIHGLANITGGAYTKLKRFWDYADVGFSLNKMPNPHKIFKVMQERGNISIEEMHKTFNMGIGFCIISPKAELQKINNICKKHRTRTFNLGKIIAEKEIRITPYKSKEICL
ncbi:MAG: phosphoribosylformylglycinamidine cyclo-ligase [Candidatus Bathyarchaeota archaeon]